ncbi:MAG TPA: helix-turn-helix transcriptional regulator [Streptosporangiaceae bacterium]|nr:helix-turn-helix transcriptional regulator [Streptosporangiaceae bacterium]
MSYTHHPFDYRVADIAPIDPKMVGLWNPKALQAKREGAGLSQQGLALKTGLSRATIIGYERAPRRTPGSGIPSLERAALLALALECRIEDFLTLPEGEGSADAQ